MSQTAGTGERVTLEVFLAGLPDADAAAARNAAARIDELARSGAAMAGIERRTLPWLTVGAIAFVAGLGLFLTPGIVNRWIIAACLAVLPGTTLAYAWRVRDRTGADNAAEDLNRAHFLPHGGLYFPSDDRPACVVRVSHAAPPPGLPLSQAPRDPRKKPLRAGRVW